MELLHLVRSGLRSSAGEDSRIFSDWIAVRIRRRPIRIGLADAVREPRTINGNLQSRQRDSRNYRSYTPGMDWYVEHLPHQLLHVPDVPDYFCDGTSRAWRGHEAWRLAPRNGDRWRRCAYTGDGTHLLTKPGICLFGTSGLLRLHHVLFIRRSTRFKESGAPRLAPDPMENPC